MAAISSVAAAPSRGPWRASSSESTPKLSTSRSLCCSPSWGAEVRRNPCRLHALGSAAFFLGKDNDLLSFLTRKIDLSTSGINAMVEAKKQTYSSFDDLLESSSKPILVDFYATWCGPCQFMVPILNEVSTKLDGRITVVKIDTEKYTEIANRYEIQALPTFILFVNGKPRDRFEGALPADQLIHRIKSAIKIKK